ncbi:FtsK/SpoIIIE family DNA translocase [Pikeienuella sp. HZG-20]|uniref:FtsK/SpoIIIE family DNA translocase n=1 Tax=Paludibacillus litoralis TaxID=3133267 RepID=UPI0030EB851B
MTSWADGERAPLLPPSAQAFLKRRGAELTGVGFLVAALALGAALVSYHADDPSWLNATESAPQNWLGAPGALLADPLLQTLGLAALGLPLVLFVWAGRLILHAGDERAWSRMILTPFAMLAGAVFASAHAPFAAWAFPAGLGGVIGDGALSMLLSALPFPAAEVVKPVTLALALATLTLAALALGVNMTEARRVFRFLLRSLLTAAVACVSLLARAVGAAAAMLRGALAKPRSEKHAPPAPLGFRRREPSLDGGAPEAGEAPTLEGESALPAILRRGETPKARPAPKPVKKSRAAAEEEQPRLALDEAAGDGGFVAPALSLLQTPSKIARHRESDAALEQNARMLESVLDDYGVRGEIGAIRPGPVVTMYELEPAPGLKASRVIGLADDIARSMSALAARVSTIPGRNVIGIELPNANREMVLLREILSADVYGDSSYRLALALGKDIGGDPVVANLAKMPHLLVAGTTGSGKSVAINTMILSLLYRLGPKECRLIMIDPKMLELSVYDGIPHLLSPVVTDPKKAVVALKWAVAEMESRYKKMSKMGVRNIDGYNARVRDALEKGEAFSRTVQTGFDKDTGQPVTETEEFEPEEMPFIVIIVDEMADLMMVAGKEIEACIQRLAQMARASGIHLIMATQRPSVDVITGTIKANFPTRISFQVTSKIDSRTILGEQGAEQLLGMGDMLYMAGGGRVTRVHGPFVSDEEVEEVVRHLKTQGQPEYVSAVTEGGDDDEEAAAIDEILGLGGDGSDDALYDQAVMIVARDRKCSTSYIQRKLAIGYNKAARIVEQMEDQGVVSAANHVGKREVMIEER